MMSRTTEASLPALEIDAMNSHKNWVFTFTSQHCKYILTKASLAFIGKGERGKKKRSEAGRQKIVERQER